MDDSGNIFYCTTELGVVRVIGEKAATFLHGQLSNSIKDLKSGSGNYNLLLTNKGKVQADAYVLNRGGFFDIIVENIFLTKIKEHLDKLAPLSRVTVTSVPTLKVLHVFGERPSLWPALDLGQADDVTHGDRRGFLFRSDRLGELGYDVIVESEELGLFVDFLKQNGARYLTANEVNERRIKNGMPKVGVDVTESNLPQEGHLDGALHFNKGCYLGQEVIARLHFRGHVNKILGHFVLENEAVVLPREIHDGSGAEVGVVTSITSDVANQKTYVLAYVPAKSFEGGESFYLGGQKLTIVQKS